LRRYFYKGWWKDPKKKIIEIDYLTFLFGLVHIDQSSDEALMFFNGWKQRFETELEQDVVLVTLGAAVRSSNMSNKSVSAFLPKARFLPHQWDSFYGRMFVTRSAGKQGKHDPSC
jgi:hypothetical protein